LHTFIHCTVMLVLFVGTVIQCEAQNQAAARHIYIFVIDGLRPDQITPQKMPNLYRFQKKSVSYLHAHSTIPTVTRVNAATLSTGVYPATHGLISNSLDLQSFSPSPLSTGEEENLLKKASLQNDRILLADSLSEILVRHGKHFVAISSGSAGGATLLAPEARHGVATVINAGLNQGNRLAYPQSVENAIRARFGYIPAHEGTSSVEWAENVLRNYVIPELHPDVTIDWITEPDTSQHKSGIGSPEAIHALAVVDRNFGEFLDALALRNDLQTSDIIVTADHGFIDTPSCVVLGPILRAAHLQPSTDVGILIDGQMASFFLRNRNHTIRARQLKSLIKALRNDTRVAALFTRSGSIDDECHATEIRGNVPGTFAIESLHLCRMGSADLIATTAWNNRRNRFGEPGIGANFSMTNDESSPASHGGLSIWTIHIPLIIHGPDFRAHCQLDLPAANIDIPATIMYLLHIPFLQAEGRVLVEALSAEQRNVLVPKHRIIYTTTRGRKHMLAITSYAGENYIDESSENRN
jgi:arylsulfatase A-like enzyme